MTDRVPPHLIANPDTGLMLPTVDTIPPNFDWTTGELILIVTDYFSMLDAELAGRAYSKAEHRRALLELVKRSEGSIEFKHQNISAVLQDLGLPWIPGYKPRSNYQNALLEAVEVHLDRHLPIQNTPFDNFRYPFDAADVLVPPPDRRIGSTSPVFERVIRKFDPAARDAHNRKLGRAGEEFVLNFERQRLNALGCGRLADKVRWVADVDGDGAGFDILSFEPDGDERLLEVKTTCGAARTPFYISRNELSLAEQRPTEFRLVRVHQFANDPKIFILEPPLPDQISIEPVAYRAAWN
ncbi:DUF3883 domain-containing protein [Hyphomicrobium sp. LHD-15]|uniref:DUF3883 domain-containing protein n=1 Tax=Hyphomicrobium sp. LHD-15 TaxID=3072142 RepID=UPI00280C7EE3|nr:DUF3883 domain-containing protein [Hyphomicrobium sp. LHD-15]MDQ8698164.1 DUF3883 domain-containing protein [Hyphomicrobium sp. LHD-15]